MGEMDPNAPAPAPEPAAPPPPTDFMASRRAATLAALNGLQPGQPALSPEPTPAPEPAPAPETPKPEPVQPQPDEALRKQEIHLRRKLAEERDRMLAEAKAEIDAQRSKWDPERAELESLKRARESARSDRLSAIRALGFTEADFAALGSELYAHSPEGQKDPRYAQQAEAKRREREDLRAYEDRLSKVDQKVSEFDKRWQQLEQREQQIEAQRAADAYLDEISSAATDATPLAKLGLAKDPQRTRAALAQISLEMYQASGPSDDLRDVPTHAEVLKEYDKRRAREFEIYGIDPATIGKPAPSSTAPVAPRPTATLPANGSAPTAPLPKGRLSREELIKEMQRASAQRNGR